MAQLSQVEATSLQQEACRPTLSITSALAASLSDNIIVYRSNIAAAAAGSGEDGTEHLRQKNAPLMPRRLDSL